MVQIRCVEESDRTFWFKLDRHLPESEFLDKVRRRWGYVLLRGGEPAGLLRYNLFWDTLPFCTLLAVDALWQRNGYGTRLLEHWARDMRAQGFRLLLTSTRSDETAQHFYRRLGWRDCGGLLLDLPVLAQPTELFLYRTL